MKFSIFFFFLVLPFYCHACAKSQNVKSIFAFGDSYTDTGNFIKMAGTNVPGVTISNPPYGMTFFGHPTGRVSDGRLIIDFIAQEFGLPLLPPYQAHNGNFAHGSNFAVAGTTAINVKYFEKNKIVNFTLTRSSLDYQLKWFEEVKTSLCKSPQECKNLFSTSLIMMGEIGTNDYSMLFQSGRSVQEVRNTYVPRVVKIISSAINKLIGYGAVNIAVSGQLPSGCLPLVLTLFGSSNKADYEPDTGCLKQYNDISAYHNSLVIGEITRLRTTHQNVKISYADYYNPIINIIKSPTSSGFNNTPLRACCGKDGPYNWNITQPCGGPGVQACQNPCTSLNWDGGHLTEAAYKYVANGWLHGPYADPPLKS